MRARCNRPHHRDWRYYGGKGIKVCDRWNESFNFFLEDMGERPEGMTLDRIDGEKSYCLENCRWATEIQQKRNRSNSVYVNYEGNMIHLVEAAEKSGLSVNTLRIRLKNKWSPDRLFEPWQGSHRTRASK
jgi:hypothetical protein